jgi:TP901 family phage tail tape measure protein
LKNFARVSVQAADAFEMPAEEVGNFAAKLSTSLGLSEKQIKRVFDLTNSLADAGISDEKDIVSFVDRTGASLKTLGLTMDQTLSLGATALNLGMMAETASTAIDALTNKMLTVNTLGGKNKKTFEKFMGPVGKFSKAVGDDANGALLGMLDTIKELDGNSRMEFLTAFVGQDHASKILRIADAVGELRRNQELAADESKWTNSLGKAYALKLDDFWSQWQLLKNDMKDLNITLGDMGLPAASQGLDGVRAMVREVGHGLENLKANVNMDELVAAKEAVGELVSAVTTVLRMGEKGSAIEGFFDRLTTSANLISGSVNLIKDGLQAVGVVAPDKDTSQDVWDRIKRFGKDYVEWNDGVGRAVNGVTAVNAAIDEGEKTYQQDRFRDQTSGRPTDDRTDALDAFLGGPLGVEAPIVLPPARLPNEGAGALNYERPAVTPIPTPRPSASTQEPPRRLSAAQELAGIRLPTPPPPRRLSAAEEIAGIKLPTPPAPIVTVNVPAIVVPPTNTARTAPLVSAREAEASSMDAMVRQFAALLDRAGSFQKGVTGTDVRDEAGVKVDTAEMDAAKAAAQATGTAIQTSLSVTAAPIVDASSIKAAMRDVDALSAKLQAIPGQAARASSAANAAATAQVRRDFSREASAALRSSFSDGGS